MTTNALPQNQAFALAMFANAAQHTTQSQTDLAHAAQTKINPALTAAAGAIGNWKIVWGPCVTPQPAFASSSMNAMYVVQSQDDASQYMIAIGGTNFASLFDVLEDFMTFAQVPWPYGFLESLGVAPGSAIALGTAVGLSTLQSMVPESDLPGGGTSLVDFLRTIVHQKVTITVAGHSLGGALAPTVALWLANTQQDLLCLNWDPKKNATINLQAFAGPTPGNDAFGKFLHHKLGDQGLQAHYNTLDVVPHAWQLLTTPALAEIYAIYGNCGVDPSTIEAWEIGVAALVAGVLSACGGNYTALPKLQPFPGTFFPSKQFYDPEKTALTNYFGQLGAQHIPGYFKQFGFALEWAPWLIPPTAPQLESGPFLQAITNAGAKAKPTDIVQALQMRPARKIQIGGTVVDAPRGPNEAASVVSLVHAALLKQGCSAKT